MPFGPGKYDELCSKVRLETGAHGVMIIVIEGNKGSGFSCQADLAVTLKLPELLEDVAKQIRESGLIKIQHNSNEKRQQDHRQI